MNIKDIAMNVTTLSNVMENKDKMTTDDLIKNFDGVITINDFDLIEGKDTYFVYTFEESDAYFANAGYVLNQIFSKIVEEFGTVEVARVEISKTPLKVQLSRGKTQNGNTITLVKVL